MKKVSVIVPIYNVEEYLGDCLDSLRQQSIDDFDVIMVNDGSTDGAEAICRKYEEIDSRFRYLWQKNQGLGPARNNGLKLANSEFVTFLDSDDRLDTNFLETMISIVNETGSSIVCCGFRNIDIHGENCGGREPPKNPQTRVLKGKQEKATLPVNACGKLFHRDHFGQLVFPAIKYEDLAVIPSIIFAEDTIVSYTPKTLYHYRVRPGSLARVNRNDQTNFTAFNLLREQMQRAGRYDTYSQEIEYLFVRHLLRYRIVDGWPTLSYLRRVYRYGKKYFPNWPRNYYFDSHNDVGDLKIFHAAGPFLYKLFFTTRHRLRSAIRK